MIVVMRPLKGCIFICSILSNQTLVFMQEGNYCLNLCAFISQRNSPIMQSCTIATLRCLCRSTGLSASCRFIALHLQPLYSVKMRGGVFNALEVRLPVVNILAVAHSLWSVFSCVIFKFRALGKERGPVPQWGRSFIRSCNAGPCLHHVCLGSIIDTFFPGCNPSVEILLAGGRL